MSDYSRFLELRAIRQRLAARFSRPAWLILHSGIFVVLMTAVWVYMNMGVYQLSLFRDHYVFPTWIGFGWSLLLAGHALWTYRRSAANAARREQAVEAEVRVFSEAYGDGPDLIDLHQELESELESQGHQITALAVFALFNAVSWFGTVINMGTSFAFQMTLPFAVIVAGGLSAYFSWQQQRRLGRTQGWFTRLPLRHMAAYVIGVVILGLLGMFRMVNPWDVNTIVQDWGLLLLAHIAYELVIRRLWDWLNALIAQPAKHKRSHRLALGDDGEIEVYSDEDLDDLASRLAAGQR